MFLNKKIVQHYAGIFFEYSIANNNNCNDFFYHKVKKFSSLLHKNFYLKKIIHTSLLSSTKKIEIFRKIIYSYDVFIFQFIKLLITRKREHFLEKIILEYQKIYEEEKKGFIKCIIISAFPLSMELQKIIFHKIKKINFKYRKNKFYIINKIDKSIIGGFLLRIGYTEWDFSIKSKLIYLKKNFKNY
ncbi:ATP synthase F1 subunit delta [Blattabacterium cuenoti]|uniref:ATP synthase F1 subunit delta n=1 Tax=Blattabacterium cuenoti TaxID=1653831 RepID=UPI00163CB402|nr:ATP synthase F1 subunit delta [Blattabacterium cuenoti]